MQALTGIESGSRILSHRLHAKHLLRRYIIEKRLGYFCTNWQLFKACPSINHPGQLLTENSEPTAKYDALQNLGAFLDGALQESSDVRVNCDSVRLASTATGKNNDSDRLILRGSEFTPSDINKSSKYVDMYYLREIPFTNLKSFLVKIDGCIIPPKKSTVIDSSENAGTFFLKDNERELYIITAKDKNIQQLQVELFDINAALISGESVILPSMLFECRKGRKYLEYIFEPIWVTPTGGSFRLFVDGKEWPFTVKNIQGKKVRHWIYLSQSKMAALAPKDFNHESHVFELRPPAIDNVYTSVFKNKTNGRIYILYWQSSYPDNLTNPGRISLTVETGGITEPVMADLLSGQVYEINGKFKQGNSVLYFEELPLTDWPVLITDKSAISYN